MAKKKKKCPVLTEDDLTIRDAFELAFHRLSMEQEAAGRPFTLERYDAGKSIIARRKKAIKSYFPIIKNRYKDIGFNTNVPHDFAVCCSIISSKIYYLDETYHFSTAAAIWMLDTLRMNDRLDDALPYLKAASEEMADFDMPPIQSQNYSSDIIKAMVNLILSRNGSETLNDPYCNDTAVKRKEGSVNYAGIYDRNPATLTMRERFDTVISMLPDSFVGHAVETFKDKIFQYLDTLFKAVKQNNATLVSIHEKIERIEDTSLAQLDKMLVPDSSSKMDTLLKENTQIKFEQVQEILSKGIPPMLPQQLLEELYPLMQKEEEYLKKELALLIFTFMIPLVAPRKLSGTSIEKKQLSYFEQLTVDDPFEICFAFIYLLDSGDDAFWLFSPDLFVMFAAIRKLPWSVFLGITDDDCIPEDIETIDTDSSEFENIVRNNILPKLDTIKAAVIQENKSIYKLDYKNTAVYREFIVPDEENKKKEVHWPLNISQIVYGLSAGFLIPGNPINCSLFEQDLLDSGIEPALAHSIASYLSFTHFNKKVEFKESLPDPAPAPMPTSSTPNFEGQAAKITLLEEQLAAANKLIGEQKKELYEAQKLQERTKNALDAINKKADEERQELADLRELAYNYANDRYVYEQNNDASEDDLPYTAKKQTIIFGGHDTWLKAIKPMLPNVVFIPRDQLPNAEQIRYSDVVWMQPNAIGHANYYKILNVVRNHHIPIHYFNYASARKCALQLKESEEGLS